MNSRRLTTAWGILALLLAAATPAQAITITLSSGSNPWNSGGVTAWARAYGYSGGQFRDGSLGQWSQGLGTCYSEPGSGCNDPYHQVDNAQSGEDEWILLLFSQPVNVSGVRLNTTNSSDTDMSWYAGLTGVSPIQNLDLDPSGSSNDWDYADVFALPNFQQGSSAPAGEQNSRDVAFSATGVNFLLVGTFLGPNDTYCSAYFRSGPNAGACKTWSPLVDMYKLKSVTFSIPPPPPDDTVPAPEPTSLLLLGSGLLGLAHRARRRRS